MAWRHVERITIAALLIATTVTTAGWWRAARRADRAQERVDVLVEQRRAAMVAAEAERTVIIEPSAPVEPAPVATGPDPDPVVTADATTEIGGAPATPQAHRRGSRTRAPAVPGGELLNALYDAADSLAAQEGWDPGTYTAVVDVFERTMGEMGSLWTEMRRGAIDPRGARQAAYATRAAADDELAEILGEDGVTRLYQHMRAEVQDVLAAKRPSR